MGGASGWRIRTAAVMLRDAVFWGVESRRSMSLMALLPVSRFKPKGREGAGLGSGTRAVAVGLRLNHAVYRSKNEPVRLRSPFLPILFLALEPFRAWAFSCPVTQGVALGWLGSGRWPAEIPRCTPRARKCWKPSRDCSNELRHPQPPQSPSQRGNFTPLPPQRGETSQPRATPWVSPESASSPERAAQIARAGVADCFAPSELGTFVGILPRALPWAGLGQAVGLRKSRAGRRERSSAGNHQEAARMKRGWKTKTVGEVC